MQHDSPNNNFVKNFTLLGFPVEHSLSPILQNIAFSHLGISARYLLSPIGADRLGEAVLKLRNKDCGGFNVTAPHKTAVIPHIDRLDASAVEAGAVNAVVNEKGVLTGFNFDGEAALRSLRGCGVDINGRRIALLGAGGAAAAVAASLSHEYRDAIGIIILNRTPAKGDSLADRIKDASPVEVAPLDEQTIRRLLPQAQILINATGVRGQEYPFHLLCDALHGIARTRLKESNRVKAVRDGLLRCGIISEEEDNELAVIGGNPHGSAVNGYDDHRIVMAFSILGLTLEEGISVTSLDSVRKSFPGFYDALKGLGAKVEVSR